MRKGFEPEQTVTREERLPKGPQNAKERIYEKLRMPLWMLDTLLILLGVAVVVFLVLGILEGRAS